MAQNGRQMRIGVSDGSGSFTVIAGAREDSMTMENGEINVTNKDSNSRRELLENGTQLINLSVSGVFVGGGSGDTLFEKARNGTIDDYQLEFESGETIEAGFQIRSYERTGSHDGEVTFTAELQSSGDYTYSAAS